MIGVYSNVNSFIDLYQLFVQRTNLWRYTIRAEIGKDGQVHQVNTKKSLRDIMMWTKIMN